MFLRITSNDNQSFILMFYWNTRKKERVDIEKIDKHWLVESDRLGCLLKSPIFIVRRAAAPKNGEEFCQKLTGAIRCSVVTSYDDVRRRAVSVPVLANQKFVVGGWVVV